MKFKPMLSAKFEADTCVLTFPVLVSPKLDGVRALVIDGVVYSRNLKPIPNQHVQRLLGRRYFNGLDGELIVGSATDKDAYRKTCSGVMSIEGTPDVTYHVFDIHTDLHRDAPFKDRLELAHVVAQHPALGAEAIEGVAHDYAHDMDDICRLEAKYLELGYEGLMIRSLHGQYKCGRATPREGSLFKMKQFSDSEAEIIGYEELFSNQNIAEVSELGNTKRSSHKDNMVPMNTLGALLVRDVHNGVEFSIGSGFTQELRAELWAANDSDLLGKIVKYKHFAIGAKDKPRFPVFLGFRSKIDF